MAATTTYSRDDLDLIVELAGCSLDEKPGSNWVQGAGGLPEYICEIARAIKRGGKTTSQAIAIAVSRVKKWAAGVGVDKDTQAKAAKALAEWEALKAKSKAKSGAKKSAHTLAASAGRPDTVLCLTDYSMDDVRSAFTNRTNEIRREWRKNNPTAVYDDGPPYLYVKEVWNTFIIVTSDYGRDALMYKVPYTVADNNEITFGDAVEVKTQYIEVTADDLGDTLDDTTLAQVAAMTHTSRVTRHHRPAGTALDRVLALSADAAADDSPEPAETDDAPAETPGVEAVDYADPGHQADKKPRYQLRTANQVKAAWAMINQSLNSRKYQAWQLAHIKANIQAAAHRQKVDLVALSAAIDAHPAVGRLLALSAGDED